MPQSNYTALSYAVLLIWKTTPYSLAIHPALFCCLYLLIVNPSFGAITTSMKPFFSVKYVRSLVSLNAFSILCVCSSTSLTLFSSHICTWTYCSLPIRLCNPWYQGLYLAPFCISHVFITYLFICSSIQYTVSQVGDIIMITVLCKHFWNLKDLDDFYFTCGNECW